MQFSSTHTPPGPCSMPRPTTQSQAQHCHQGSRAHGQSDPSPLMSDEGRQLLSPHYELLQLILTYVHSLM